MILEKKKESSEVVPESPSLSKVVTEENMVHPVRDISIWIDNYDDIFSDFDPRPISERNISDDFLYELKKVCKESSFPIGELKLLVPEKSRNAENEIRIIKRLHSQLRNNYHYFLEQIKIQKRKGILFTLSGMAMIILESFISLLQSKNFAMHTLLVMLEPAGWFLVWTGLDDLLKSARKQKPELDFYNKMAKCKIIFVSY